jgi:hypothetical protein
MKRRDFIGLAGSPSPMAASAGPAVWGAARRVLLSYLNAKFT